MQGDIIVIQTGDLGVNTYIIPLGDSKVMVIDPADSLASNDAGNVSNCLKKNNLECSLIVLTHGHFDHILGIGRLKKDFPAATIAIHKEDSAELGKVGLMNSSILQYFSMEYILDELSLLPPADVLLSDGKLLSSTLNNCSEAVGKELSKWKVIHTPGHSPGSICLYNKEDMLLISGDTVFAYGDYGRTDMYGGDEVSITRSISNLKKIIPEHTRVFPGHGTYGFEFDL